MELKPQAISQHVLREKYLRENERCGADIYRRVARALASVEVDPLAWEARFLAALHGGFIPAGRILAAAGTKLRATLMNCFVQPVGDSLTGRDANARPGIMVALQQAAETLRCGGGVGYNFSHIRPHGALVKGTDSSAGGPLSYLCIFDAMCQTVESAGVRRGAQMGILNCDHPDIEAFIDAKARPYPDKELTQFNLSVGVSEAFMAAVVNDTDWALVHEAEPGAELKRNGAWRRDATRWVYATVRARELWERLMRSTYEFADPGVVFIDRLNGENNLGYTETIECTNPCSEQPLPDYGCCDLGSLNLVHFVRHPFTARAAFDFAAMAALVPVAIRLLDNQQFPAGYKQLQNE